MIGPSPFHVWGWPWRGLGTDYEITGYDGTAFRDGQSWLIDLGLPAISLTADETAEASAEGYTWQNYTHVSGGYVYGKNLQVSNSRKDSYIHIDEDGAAWLVRVAVTFPGGDVVDITLTLKPFGFFGAGEASADTYDIEDIACEEITPTGYDVDHWTIEDVWKNGEKAILSLFGVDSGRKYIHSLIEITITGGTATINPEAAEIMGGEDTTHTAAPYELLHCGGPSGGNACNYTDRTSESWLARFAYYKSDGSAALLRLHKSSSQMHTGSPCAGTSGPVDYEDILVTELLENSTQVLLIVREERTATFDVYCQNPSAGWTADFTGFIADNIDMTSATMSLTSQSDQDICEIGATDFDYTPDGISLRTYTDSGDVHRFGFVRGISNAYALYYIPPVGAVVYSQVITPTGLKAWPAACTSGTLHHAWNRKTGDTAFAADPICYV